MPKLPTLPTAPVTSEALLTMSRQLIGGTWRETDIDDVAALLGGLEKEMTAFHRIEHDEVEPVVVYSPAREP